MARVNINHMLTDAPLVSHLVSLLIDTHVSFTQSDSERSRDKQMQKDIRRHVIRIGKYIFF